MEQHSMVSLSREISQEDFTAFTTYASKLAGISMGENKKHLLISRLIRRVRDLGLPDLASYRHYMDTHLDQESGQFVNAITTNLTSFFREAYHFETLKSWLADHPSQEYKIWSAGCSTGQEPYSISMTFESRDLLPYVRIQATDIDTQVLAKAAKGVYRDTDIEAFDPGDCQRWFQRGVGENSGMVRVKSKLANVIDFKELNLLGTWPGKTQFDVIFCRNVFIYFDADTQSALLKRFAERLKPGGLLFLGHSESIRSVDDLFEQDGRTTYRRTGKLHG